MSGGVESTGACGGASVGAEPPPPPPQAVIAKEKIKAIVNLETISDTD
jgi:hypothetical protein